MTPAAFTRTLLSTCACLAALASPCTLRAAEAAAPPDVWDLTSLFPDTAAWDRARRDLLDRLPRLQALRGTLAQGAPALRKALDEISAARRQAERIEVYANLEADADTRVSAAQQRRQLAESLDDAFGQATSWLAPEVSALGAERVDADIAAEPGLAPHAYSLHTLIRLAGHTLAPGEEALLAAAAKPLEQPNNVYSLLAAAELPWPSITVHGRTRVLDQETYVALRDDADPKVRAQVFKAFWPTFKRFERTIGALYVAHLDGEVFQARARKYGDTLELATSPQNTPTQVYRTLVAETNAGLPTLHRFMKLRSRLLGLKDPRYSDVYAPLARPPARYTLAQAEDLTLKAVQPLGDDYVQALRRHFLEHWMDAVPRPGKQSGAYMSGEAYDVHPFVLLSFNGNYESVSTVAHEWGHAMHTVLANSAQPFETSDYGIFVAEIPSTANEMLLSDYVTAHARTKAEKIYALGQQLELLRATFFRQAMFAEFELRSHEAIEQGKPLTGEDLSQLYLDLLRRYQGEAEGAMRIDPLYGVEWAYVPHFYRDFYVFQYATSIAAAAYFVEGIERGDTTLRDRYLSMLKAGASDDAYRLVKAAGPDMAGPEPYRALVRRMDRLLDQIEALAK